NGSADPLHCQDTPEGVEFPAPVPPEQNPPDLPPIEANGLEPAESEATVTPVTSPESTLGAVSWVLPLVWLEKTLSNSFLVESLRHSLPLRKPQQDASSSVTPVPTVVTGTSTTPVPTVVTGTSTTPVPTVVTGTSTTPVPTVVTGTSITPVPTVRSMNTSRGSLPCAKDSAAETDSLLWHCPREQLKTLPRAELEGRLESTLIIIEVLSLQLRDWQESQRLQPGVGPAKQRDAFTQTDSTPPEGVRALSEAMPPLSLSLPQSSQSLLLRGLADATFRSLQDEQEVSTSLCLPFPLGLAHTAAVPGVSQCCHLPQQEKERTLVSQCQAVLESAPSKVQSCLEERDAIRQRVDE
ncbi:SPAG5 protein, partial [Thryothorus ludovicianus]|nr:SPAG5 protein [Thryothorus ludovicianus]